MQRRTSSSRGEGSHGQTPFASSPSRCVRWQLSDRHESSPRSLGCRYGPCTTSASYGTRTLAAAAPSAAARAKWPFESYRYMYCVQEGAVADDGWVEPEVGDTATRRSHCTETFTQATSNEDL